jgi:Ca-activated chloride channel family protein
VGQDIVVAVDLSTSMLAEDVAPSRLERARLAILRLIGNLDGDRIGLVAFAGSAFVQSPLTVDYSAAGMFLGAMHPDLMPVQGTDLGAALRVSLDALEQGAREARVIVLVTDGENLEGDFEEDLERAVESGVQVHVVGVGSSEGAPIPQYDPSGRRTGFLRDEDGTVVTTRLDEATLRAVAEKTGARYVRAGAGGTAFDDLVDEITGVEGEALDARQITQFEEQFQIFLGVALVLLLIEWLLPERRRERTPWAGRFE